MLLSKEYLKAYSGGAYGTKSVTFSAIDVSKLSAIENSAREIAAQLKAMSTDDFKKVKSALNTVQSYYYSDYKDYGHFLKVVEALPVKKDAALFARARSEVGTLVLTTDSSPSFVKSTGVSLWLPTYETSDMARYKGLAFDKVTKWSGFLERVLKP